jgi:hypothetical protein
MLDLTDLIGLAPEDDTLTGRGLIQTIQDLRSDDPDRQQRARETLRAGILLNPWDAAILARHGLLKTASRVELPIL